MVPEGAVYLDLSSIIEQMDREDSFTSLNQLNSIEEAVNDIQEEIGYQIQNTLPVAPTYSDGEEESDNSDEEIETPLANHTRRLSEVDQSTQFAQRNRTPLQRGFNSLCSGYYSLRFQP